MKNLCILVVVLVSVFSFYLVQSATVQEHEKAPESEKDKEKGGEAPQLRDYITDCFNLQNFYRAKHGSPPLRLDPALSATAAGCAAMYANGAALHSCAGNQGRGESTASTVGPISLAQLCTMGVNIWYRENSLYNYNNPNINDWDRTGHFTYMIWKSTTTIGIGCASAQSVQCVSLYYPQGNIPTVQAYRNNVGPPRKEEEEEENIIFIDPNYNITIS